MSATGEAQPFALAAERIIRSVESRADPGLQKVCFLFVARQEGTSLKSNLFIQGWEIDPFVGERYNQTVRDFLLVLSMIMRPCENTPTMRRAGEHSRRREQEIESPEERTHRASLRNRKETSATKTGSSKLFLPRTT